MKRKKLLEFAVFLGHTRREFYMGNGCDCVSGHTQKFLGRNVHDATQYTLQKAFDLTYEQAWALWGGPTSATRKAATAVIRFLAKTGKVDWERALALPGGRRA